MTLSLFDGSVIEAGRSLRDMDERLAAYTRLFLVFLAAVLTLGAGAGYLVAWRLTSGIERVSDAARRIADGDLSQRVGAKHESDEIDRLVDAFNAMSENNEALVTELRTVTDDIAHDLRTPLTRIRGMAEVTAAGETSPDGFREMCGAVAEECDSMMQLINEMLEITRTESAIDRLERSEFSLSGLVQQAGALFCEIAEDRNVALAVSVPEQEIAIRADKLKIQRMTANLLDNALKFTPPGGRVELTLALRNGAPVLEVRDTGCGISPAREGENLQTLLPLRREPDAARQRPRSRHGAGDRPCAPGPDRS